MNIKKIIILCFVAGMIATLTSCTSNIMNQNDNTNNTASSVELEKDINIKIEKDIDSVAEKLGLTGGVETLYSMIGANAGKEYNDGSVELYQFDEKSEVYKQIIGDNSPLKVSAYKNGIVLIFPVGTEEDKNLIYEFNSIEFK